MGVNTYYIFSGLFTSINPSYDLGFTRGTRVLTHLIPGEARDRGDRGERRKDRKDREGRNAERRNAEASPRRQERQTSERPRRRPGMGWGWAWDAPKLGQFFHQKPMGTLVMGYSVFTCVHDIIYILYIYSVHMCSRKSWCIDCKCRSWLYGVYQKRRYNVLFSCYIYNYTVGRIWW